MPAPLAMPATVTVFPPTENFAVQVLRRVSDVRIASAARRDSAGSRERFFAASAMPRAIFSIGRLTPMRPVEQTKNCSGETPQASAASAHIAAASFMPCSPVQALAFPLVATMPRMGVPAAAPRRCACET